MRNLLMKALTEGPATKQIAPNSDQKALQELALAIKRTSYRRFGRSLAIREVDAGSCNGCELEVNALGNPFYDLERFGLSFVASPRHADVLLVTGPVSLNMKEALERTYRATPDPKWVVAVGDCAKGCGVYAQSPACVGSVSQVLPVSLHIEGCPPRPLDLLKGFLSLMETCCD